jgi:hypothetical protein
MGHQAFRVYALIFALTLATSQLHAQPVNPGLGEWGDAPEGVVAYPQLGVIGQFPTIFLFTPAGYVYHGNPSAWFGNGADLEDDGNAATGFFPPFDLDECYGPLDLDAGLFNPAAYTIDLGMNVVPCDTTSLLIPLLGNACGVIQPFAATILDLLVQNFSGNPAVINILFDWDQDGRWGGQISCPNGNIAEEHAVVNLLVPDPYIGTLGGLGVPQIYIGPNTGNIWTRFSIMNENQAPPADWDGSGEFDVGETEDYLLRVGGNDYAEYGDAPEGVLAYPNGVNGNFPTCTTTVSAGVIQHMGNAICWFGPQVDTEFDGNAGDCTFNTYDDDECDAAGGDAGLLFPDAFTFTNGVVAPCTFGQENVLWSSCTLAEWGVHVDISVTNNAPDVRYVNVLADWDENGEWSGTQSCAPLLSADEHLLVDWPIPGGFSGPLSTLLPPDFLIGGTQEYCWVRFSITDQQVGAGWDGDGTFGEGETEDYLIQVDPAPTARDIAGAPTLIHDLTTYPNPFNPRVTLRFTLATAGELNVRIVNSAGRQVSELYRGRANAGEMQLRFEGLDDRGATLPSGVYFAEVRMGDERHTRKLLMLK